MKILNFPDGSRAEIEADGSYDLCLPNGKHQRGKCCNKETARVVVNEIHEQYVLTQWAKGTPTAKSNFLVPLS